MKLLPAPGSRDMQAALANQHVKKVVENLLVIVKAGDMAIFKAVVRLLKRNEQNTSSGFAQDLLDLRESKVPTLDKAGQSACLLSLNELCSALEGLYNAKPQVVNFRRGAVVELFAYHLIKPRCGANECQSNHRFIDPSIPYQSDQIDVAVLSEINGEIEGYSCKLSAGGISSNDCNDLRLLCEKADEQGYLVHVGTICFDRKSIIQQRLQLFSADFIVAYGLENIVDLSRTPFDSPN